MAHRQAGPSGPQSDELPEPEPGNESAKALINRRKYLTLGATATAALFVTGTAYSVAGDPGDGENTYWTDFSEVSL
ncbi:MAG: hypothetical protein ACQET5_08560 [Halobacteriota archaeon]|uniref:hypothetical protein n=1 Tax=Natronomonas sp. TaxID=2184060 RepID=UPI0039749286